MSLYNGRSNYYGWENAFTRRMINHVQTSVTYTLSEFKDATHVPWLWYIDNGHLQRKDLGFALRPTWAANTAWRRPTSGIERFSTGSGKRRTACR